MLPFGVVGRGQDTLQNWLTETGNVILKKKFSPIIIPERCDRELVGYQPCSNSEKRMMAEVGNAGVDGASSIMPHERVEKLLLLAAAGRASLAKGQVGCDGVRSRELTTPYHQESLTFRVSSHHRG